MKRQANRVEFTRMGLVGVPDCTKASCVVSDSSQSNFAPNLRIRALEPDVFIVAFDQGFECLREGVVIAVFGTGRHLQDKHPRSGLQGLNRKHDGGQNSDEHKRNRNSRGHSSG